MEIGELQLYQKEIIMRLYFEEHLYCRAPANKCFWVFSFMLLFLVSGESIKNKFLLLLNMFNHAFLTWWLSKQSCKWKAVWSTIIFIIFWDFLMSYQVLFSAHVKWYAIITYKYGIYELPHELLNNWRVSKLGNIRNVLKLHRMIVLCPVSPLNWKFC